MERFNNLVNKILLNIKVNEETDEDEGYGSIAGGSSRIKSMVWGKCENSVCNLYIAVSKSSRRRKEIRQEDLKIIESDTKEVLIEKFLLLRDAYDELKDDTTRLEFEVESLKDAQDDGEEEVIFLILDCWTTIFTYI